MRTLCPNLDREDALETVLEVPIPEEMFGFNEKQRRSTNWIAMKKPFTVEKMDSPVEIQFMLGVIGAPLIPLPIPGDRKVHDRNINGHPIERSMAKYIVQQYIAASGGEHALDSIDSMCAISKVKMASSAPQDFSLQNNNTKLKNMKLAGLGKLGGFVLWQKRPHLWSLDLMVEGNKISAGSDGKVAWRQTPWQQHSRASRGPPRPSRRSLQGLDPRSTANLFSDSIFTSEKTIKNEDCFVLKLDVEPCALRARSSKNVEIIKHTLWGYFSQKTGLLVQLEDSHLLRIKSVQSDVYWETNTESFIQDYRTIDGVNIAHSGKTSVSLLRFEENYENCTITRMEEVWSVEEVDFNVKGLLIDCFLPPADLRKEDTEGSCGVVNNGDIAKNGHLRYTVLDNFSTICAAKSGCY